jgi:hypothetical protein
MSSAASSILPSERSCCSPRATTRSRREREEEEAGWALGGTAPLISTGPSCGSTVALATATEWDHGEKGKVGKVVGMAAGGEAARDDGDPTNIGPKKSELGAVLGMASEDDRPEAEEITTMEGGTDGTMADNDEPAVARAAARAAARV